MREEWLNRIAITWANRTRQRLLRTVLDQYSSATEAVARHSEMMTCEAMVGRRWSLSRRKYFPWCKNSF